MLPPAEDVVAAGRLADAVDANVVRVRAAARSVNDFALEQVVSAGMFHPAVQLAAILFTDWNVKKKRARTLQSRHSLFEK